MVNLPEIRMKLIIQFLFLCSILSPSLLFSQKQNGLIKGRIVTIEGEPAGGVSVRLKLNGRMVIADANGIFVLQHLPALYDSLIISSVGSYQYRKKVLLKEGESLNIGTIQLTYHIEKLQTVEINGRLAHSYKSDYSFFDAKTETAVKDIPQSVSSITKELIHDKMEFTLKDAAENVAGVNQYSGYDEYTIRGFRAKIRVTLTVCAGITQLIPAVCW